MDTVSRRDLLKKAYDLLETNRTAGNTVEQWNAASRMANSYIALAEALGNQSIRV